MNRENKKYHYEFFVLQKNKMETGSVEYYNHQI